MDVQPLFRHLSPAIVVDVETGGLDPLTSPLLEVAVGIVQDGYLVDVYAARVLPYDPERVDPEAAQVVGYTDAEEWAQSGAVSEAEALRGALDFVQAHHREERVTWIGHNAAFDRGFLAAAAKRTDLAFLGEHCRHRDIDTMVLATVPQAAGILPSRSLDALCLGAGVERSGRRFHSAAEDVRLTWAALGWLLLHLRWRA